MVNNELQHHGILGQKKGQRRFQNKDGSLTPLGRLRYGVGERRKERKLQKQRAEALEKARETKKTKAEEAAEKKRVLESGTAEEVLKYKGQLTNKELGDAYNRLNYERLIADISSKEVEQGQTKIQEFISKLDEKVDTAQKGLDTYNKGAKIVNSLVKTDLPIFEGKKKDKAAESALNKLVKSGTAEEITRQFGKLSSEQLKTAKTRFDNEKAIKGVADEEKRRRSIAEANRAVDKYNENWRKGVTEDSTRPKIYSKSGDDLVDARLDTKTNKGSKVERVDGEVVGEGTSRSNIKNDSGFTKKDKPANYYDPIDTSFVNNSTMSEVRNSEQARLGETYIAGLLEDKSR